MVRNAVNLKHNSAEPLIMMFAYFKQALKSLPWIKSSCDSL